MAVSGTCVRVPCIKGWFVQILDEEDGAGVELSNVNVMSRPDPPAYALKHMQDTVDKICAIFPNGIKQWLEGPPPSETELNSTQPSQCALPGPSTNTATVSR